jgi:enamine deaminase RidA (YjgF/YER057c/UK114 family)
MSDTPESRLAALGLTLPPVPAPVANYVPWRREGNQLFSSGVGPRLPDGTWMRGKLGADATVEQGYQAARICGLNLLAIASDAAGGLGRVSVLKVLGMVNCTPDFGDQPAVINGCSDLFVAVLGEAGRHARSAVGFVSLPSGIMTEIEAVFRIGA